MEYRISDMQLNSTKRKGYLMITMAFVLGISMASVAPTLITGVIIFLALTGILAPMGWQVFRTELPWEQNHRLIVEEGTLTHLNEGTVTHVELSSIQNFIFKRKRGKVKSIVIDRGRGMKEEMPKYENIDHLASELEQQMPPEKIINKKVIF